MAMNFWEAQRRARARTTVYLILFTLLTIAIGMAVEWAMRYFAGDAYNPPLSLFRLVLFSVDVCSSRFSIPPVRIVWGKLCGRICRRGARAV